MLRKKPCALQKTHSLAFYEAYTSFLLWHIFIYSYRFFQKTFIGLVQNLYLEQKTTLAGKGQISLRSTKTSPPLFFIHINAVTPLHSDYQCEMKSLKKKYNIKKKPFELILFNFYLIMTQKSQKKNDVTSKKLMSSIHIRIYGFSMTSSFYYIRTKSFQNK